MTDYSAPTATKGTITSVASSASSVLVLAANSLRKGACVYNDSTQVLYLALTSAVASNSAYTVQIAAGGYYELPSTSSYVGPVNGIWASANGNARVTELT